ncbi:MAG: triose-phosphate isomerase [Candidatus Nanoarchaeia archaeon]
MKERIVINFKNYKQGKEAVKLGKKLDKLPVIIAVSASDIYEIKKQTSLKIYAQHVDAYKKGRHTGFILPEAVKADGASGTILNHSEHALSWRILKKSVKRCKQAGLKVIICCSSLKQAKKACRLKPKAIAFEVPELIASKKSISSQRPASVKKFSQIIRKYNDKHKTRIEPLCGAGISSSKDVKSAISLGCQGILVSSAVVKSSNPKKKVKEFLDL